MVGQPVVGRPGEPVAAPSELELGETGQEAPLLLYSGLEGWSTQQEVSEVSVASTASAVDAVGTSDQVSRDAAGVVRTDG